MARERRGHRGRSHCTDARTFRSLRLYQPLEQEVERLAAHLSDEHEQDFDLAV